MQRPTSELILDRLSQLHPKRIDLSLGRMHRLLEVLGHPERRLAPVVHIAGTNGKGSTLAMLAAMLRADGRRLHRYISPHLVHFNERILLRDAPIDEARLADVLDRCERANGDAPITFFEITTAAALLAFAEDPVDAVLLETGLGGRLDATNVVDRPALTLISPVSMDHEAYLGDTLAAIAGEKAGILKPGVPAIAGPQRAEAEAVLRARAASVEAPLRLHGRDWRVVGVDGGIVVEDGGETLELPRPGLVGEHQVENAGLAVMAARALGAL
ncbi:MAG: bifunctional folylpolyglutamate synthase/dihydrofolate synthase, partial [Geminicoccaceae bacterium]